MKLEFWTRYVKYAVGYTYAPGSIFQGWDGEKTRLKKPGFFQTGFMGFFKKFLKKPATHGFFQKFEEF